MPANNNNSLRGFFEKQFDFCWENQRINCDTREKLLRIYIAVLSILPAFLMILFRFENKENYIDNCLNQVNSVDTILYSILIFTLFIITIFSFLTFKRNLSLRKSIIRFRKNISASTTKINNYINV